MVRLPPGSTRAAPRCPYTTLFRSLEMAEVAELLRRHGDRVRAAAAGDLEMPHRARRQGIAGVRDNVAAPEFLRGLGENARHVQCDIAVADHRDAGGSE